MKAKANAKQKREAAVHKIRERWSPKKEGPAESARVPVPTKPAVIKAKDLPQQSPEEETREFLDYLERYNGPIRKDDTPPPAKRRGKTGTAAGTLNLEDGMPTVEEAIGRLRIGLQEMKVSRVKVVKLIHGYGSTGRGGKIRTGIRNELAEMKRRGLIREFIHGEDFGPTDAASRRLADQEHRITKDPDYGSVNHGITMVVL